MSAGSDPIAETDDVIDAELHSRGTLPRSGMNRIASDMGTQFLSQGIVGRRIDGAGRLLQSI